MSSAPEDRDRRPPADPLADSCFRPRPVDPETARPKAPAVDVDRSVVELMSPIGHRLRVPPTTAGGAAEVASPSVLDAGSPPASRQKKTKKRR
ncbi:MAG: hypothetical protein ACREI7_07970 [Myxococcota bacterium]